MGPALGPHAEQVRGGGRGRVGGRERGIAAWPERTSTRRALGGGQAEPTQVGGWPPRRGGARAKPRGSEHQGAPLLRWGEGRPLSVVLRAGQRHESKQLEAVL